MQDYYRSGRMLVRMAEAIGRLVLSGRELTRLAGYSHTHTHTHKCHNLYTHSTLLLPSILSQVHGTSVRVADCAQ